MLRHWCVILCFNPHPCVWGACRPQRSLSGVYTDIFVIPEQNLSNGKTIYLTIPIGFWGSYGSCFLLSSNFLF